MRPSRLLLALMLGCGPATTPAPPATPVSPAPPPATPEALRVAGDDALFTLFLRPERWEEVRASTRPLLQLPLPRELHGLLAAPTPADAGRALLPRELRGLFEELPGLDPARPVVIRIGEVGAPGLAQAVAVSRMDARSSLRHVIALPARDGAALEAALQRELAAAPGAGATTALHRSHGHVFVVFSPGGAPSTDGLVGDGPAEPTAAARHAADDAHPLAMLVRPGRAQAWSTASGASHIALALAMVADRQEELRLAGLADVARAHLHTESAGDELAAIGVALAPPETPEARAALTFVASLGERGRGLVAAGASPSPTASGGPPSALTFRSALDLGAMRDAAGPPPSFAELGSPGRIARSFQACGYGCLVAAASDPFAHAALAESLGALPSARSEGLLASVVDPALPPGAVEGRLDVALLGERVGEREIAALAEVVPALTLRSRVVDGAWVGVFGGERAAERRLDDLVARARGTRPVASGARENDAARACLRRFGHAVVDGLEVFTAAAPEERERLVAAARAEAAPHRACAAADPTLADALAGWDAVLAELP
ncbi:MAG TPA: hypothetical protein RMH85_13870 [Polyangiaceae bacterium LLY-WYZ-15_(1-7)]|nr:hypothetical protein [Sandaracinus sp.]HJL03471.1 hypothetical protein [Polyangiaceae bacterium LLY-WYZ-15_(1-7)]HJL09586.1 hypothetical protein [Polyangiaceae bacterium LLY-WYZ-15_(1-7)]